MAHARKKKSYFWATVDFPKKYGGKQKVQFSVTKKKVPFEKEKADVFELVRFR